MKKGDKRIKVPIKDKDGNIIRYEERVIQNQFGRGFGKLDMNRVPKRDSKRQRILRGEIDSKGNIIEKKKP